MQPNESRPAPRLDWRTRLLHTLEEKCQDEAELNLSLGGQVDPDEWLPDYDPYAIHPKAVGIIEQIVPLVVDLEESHALFGDVTVDPYEFIMDAVAQYRHKLECKSRAYHQRLAVTGVPASQPRLKLMGCLPCGE